MPRPKMPAVNKQGKSETKAQLQERAEYEEMLKGDDSMIDIAPPDLDELGKAYYTFIVNEIKGTGILCNVDTLILKQISDSLSKMDMCDEILAREGLLVEEANPQTGMIKLKEHPTVKTKATYATAFRAYASQLGLSPAARAGIAGMKMEQKMAEEDPVLKVLRGDV